MRRQWHGPGATPPCDPSPARGWLEVVDTYLTDGARLFRVAMPTSSRLRAPALLEDCRTLQLIAVTDRDVMVGRLVPVTPAAPARGLDAAVSAVGRLLARATGAAHPRPPSRAQRQCPAIGAPIVDTEATESSLLTSTITWVRRP